MRVEYVKLLGGKLWPVTSCTNADDFEVVQAHRETGNA